MEIDQYDGLAVRRTFFSAANPTISMNRLLALLILLFTGITHAIDIPFTLDKPMRVSINVYDSKGAIVRSLLCGAPRQKCRLREFWDGRDQAGNPLPAGKYSWKLLAMPPRREQHAGAPA